MPEPIIGRIERRSTLLGQTMRMGDSQAHCTRTIGYDVPNLDPVLSIIEMAVPIRLQRLGQVVRGY